MLLLSLLLCVVAVPSCPPGSYYWVSQGIARCALCLPGCACPGGYVPCYGCSGGQYASASNASSCDVCPPGTTSDYIFNAGCDPENFLTPCSNLNGAVGQIACRPEPPNSAVQLAAPSGALSLPPQYLTSKAPYVPNKVPPWYDEDGEPSIQQSY